MLLTFARSLLCAIAILCVGAWSALAETPKPLVQIGQHPFTGSIEEGCRLHESAHDLMTYEECLAAFQAADSDLRCPPTYPLQEGTVWWMLFTRDGVHRIGLYIIAFGNDVSPSDPMRRANDCQGRTDVAPAVKPLACGNFAVPQQWDEPEPYVCKCEPTDSRTVYPGVTLGGVYHDSCCPGCDFYTPGIGTSDFIDGGQGQSCTCQ